MTCGAVKAEATIASAVHLRTPLIGMRTSPSTGPVSVGDMGRVSRVATDELGAGSS